MYGELPAGTYRIIKGYLFDEPSTEIGDPPSEIYYIVNLKLNNSIQGELLDRMCEQMYQQSSYMQD